MTSEIENFNLLTTVEETFSYMAFVIETFN